MNTDTQTCPQCGSIYCYQDRTMMICPECGHEWDPVAVVDEEDSVQYRDAAGNLLQEGDKITLSKDLKVKGSSLVLKIGTKAVIKRFVEGDHDIDCKVDGAGDLLLKTAVVKKA